MAAYFLRNFVLSGDAVERRARDWRIGLAEPVSDARRRAVHGAAISRRRSDRAGLERVVMLTHGLWQRRYGSDPAIVGKAILVNDRAA